MNTIIEIFQFSILLFILNKLYLFRKAKTKDIKNAPMQTIEIDFLKDFDKVKDGKKLKENDKDDFYNWLIENGFEVLDPIRSMTWFRVAIQHQIAAHVWKNKKHSYFITNLINEFKAQNKITPSEIINPKQKIRNRLIERDGVNCFYCGCALNQSMTIEHIQSKSIGGADNLKNYVLAHEECNNEVGNKSIAEKVKIAVNNRLKLINKIS